MNNTKERARIKKEVEDIKEQIKQANKFAKSQDMGSLASWLVIIEQSARQTRELIN